MLSRAFPPTAESRPIFPEILGNLLAVEFEGNREEGGVDDSMVDVMQRPDGMGHGMTYPQALLKADSGHHGAHQHFPAPIDIARVFHDNGQIPRDALEGAQGDGFDHWVHSWREVFLYCVTEGVHAAAGRQEGRKAQREVWVEDGVSGNKKGACSDHFSGDAIPGGDDQGPPGHLAACSGGCRHRDERWRAVTNPGCAALENIEFIEISLVGGKEPYPFCRIDDATAADGYDPIALLILVSIQGIEDIFFARIGCDSVIDRTIFDAWT